MDYLKLLLGFSFGDTFLEFLSFLKLKCIQSPTGVVVAQLLLNSPVFHFVDPVCEDYLYTESSVYTLPNFLISCNGDGNISDIVISKSKYYFFIY